jgi:hypothetical protein
MSSTESTAPGAEAGANSHIEISGAKPVFLRNSRILCLLTMSGSFFAAFMGVCMALMVISLLFLQGGLSAGKSISALQWGVGAFAMGYMGVRLWSLGRAMLDYQVQLDSRGVTFNLGTRKKPANLFILWDRVDAVTLRRDVNVQRCSVRGSDGSCATFSSYTFFRPGKIARVIADRAGVAIRKA